MESSQRFSNLTIVTHPLVQHKLTHMRMADTSTALFRQLLKEIALLIGFEISRGLETKTITIKTPLTTTQQKVLAGEQPVIVPILRAGLIMADGLAELMPDSPIGHIGLYRHHETKRPVEYLIRLPDVKDRHIFLVDPMIATGYSGAYAVQVLKDRGVRDDHIHFMALVTAPEGISVMQKQHPLVHIYAASLDEYLSEQSYIIPGLGDAGDRLFATL